LNITAPFFAVDTKPAAAFPFKAAAISFRRFWKSFSRAFVKRTKKVDQTAEACFDDASRYPANRESVAGEIRTSEFHARRETPERAPFLFP
jgi:hypothetical protein